MSEKLTQYQQQIVYANRQTDNFIEELKKLHSLVYNQREKEDINNVIIEYSRIMEELERGIYFVTIQGSLKTGKSTLTNLLVGEKIAITKAGQDTTKTPYVITKSKDENSKIIAYFLNQRSIQKDKKGSLEKKYEEILKAIIDDVKGLKIDNPYNAYFTKKEEKFDNKKIEKYTVEESYDEVIFINIQIAKKGNDDWLLDNDIAILDTPGIEGQKAGHNVKIVNEIKKRTNMLIAMQSTVTPINKPEIDFLKGYLNESTQLRLMHNRFELKPWADDYDKKEFEKDEKDSINKTKEIFARELEISPIFNAFNMVKVYDYMKKSKVYPDLKEEYEKFNHFKRDLIKTINEIKIEDKKNKAIKQFKLLLEKLQKEDEILWRLKENHKQELENIQNEKYEIITNFRQFMAILEDFSNTLMQKYQMDIGDKGGNIVNGINIKLHLTNPSIGRFDIGNKSAIDNITKEIEEYINRFIKEVNIETKKEVVKLINNGEEEFLQVEMENLKKFLDENNMNRFSTNIPDIRFYEDVVPDIIRENKIRIGDVIKNPDFIEKGEDLFLGKLRERKISGIKIEEFIKDSFKEQCIAAKRDFIGGLKKNINTKLVEYLEIIKKLQLEVESYFETINQERKRQQEKIIAEVEILLDRLYEVGFKLD